MIPKIEISADVTVREQPTKTYKMELYNGNYILGFVDSQKAMEQAIYKIIRTYILGIMELSLKIYSECLSNIVLLNSNVEYQKHCFRIIE